MMDIDYVPPWFPAPEHEHTYNEGRSAEVSTLIVTVVKFARGTGCCAESSFRIVTAYYGPGGELLWESDPGLVTRVIGEGTQHLDSD